MYAYVCVHVYVYMFALPYVCCVIKYWDFPLFKIKRRKDQDSFLMQLILNIKYKLNKSSCFTSTYLYFGFK